MKNPDLSRAIRRQFDFASRDVSAARLERLETILEDVDPTGAYPADWVIYRLTGVSPEASSDDRVFEGPTLVPEVVRLVEEMHQRLGPFEFDEGVHVDAPTAAAELGVSRRTLQRWRLDGLPLPRYRHPDGRCRVGCRRATLEAFARREADRVERARRYRRADGTEKRRIVARFEAALARGVSTTAAIRETAKELGRSPNAIRGIVGEGVGRGGTDPRPEVRRRERLIERASSRFVPPASIAERIGRGVDTVRRTGLELRAARIRSIDVEVGVEVPNVERPEASEVFGVAGAVDDLPRELAGSSLGPWLERIRGLPDIEDDEVVRARIAAMHFARARAVRGLVGIEGMSRPGIRLLDPIESDLRWWSLLLERHVLTGLPVGLRRYEQAIGQRLEHLPGPRIETALRLVFAAVRDVVVDFDPTRRVSEHSVGRAVALGVGRRIATEASGPSGGGAARGKFDPDRIVPVAPLDVVPARERSLLAVERWWRLASGPGREEVADRPGGEAMVVRFGLRAGMHPISLVETGRRLGTAPTRLMGPLEDAVRRLRRFALGEDRAGPSA